MQIQEIIDALCSHGITKHEAIEKLKKIFNGQRSGNALELEVISTAFSIESDHGILTLRLPYQYAKLKEHFENVQKVDVSPINY